jgi:hypothetical protein
MSDLATAASALRTTDPRFPWVHPTPEEAEVADLLAELDALHVQDGDRCVGCAERWPCKGYGYGCDLAVQWLGRAAARVYAHARQALDAIDLPKEPA